MREHEYAALTFLQEASVDKHIRFVSVCSTIHAFVSSGLLVAHFVSDGYKQPRRKLVRLLKLYTRMVCTV